MAKKTVDARREHEAWRQGRKKRIKSEIGVAKFNYQERNLLLLDIGFVSYSEYLKSDIWDAIRAKTLEVHKDCFCCRQNKATQAHHRRYSQNNLRLLVIGDMIGVCNWCHERIEFTFDKGYRTGKRFG